MIKFDPLWKTMERRGITQYDLYTHHNVNRSQINRLRQNQNVEESRLSRGACDQRARLGIISD